MKKLFLLVVTVLLASAFTLMGCASSSSGLKTNPALTDAVINNGGITVQKGDYLYFMNGYTATENLVAGDNDWGDTSIYGAIYRTKLNADNSVSYDADGFLTCVELVVPKIAGYKNSSFYVYGNYIYYSSPNNNKDRYGNSLTTLTDYFRVDINGTNNQKLYTSTTENLTASDWAIYVTGSTHYLVVKDDTKLVSVKASDKIGGAVTMANNVSSVAFYGSDTFYNNERAVADKYTNYIYYTRSTSDSDNLPSTITGNILARVKVNTSTEEIVYSANSHTYELKALKNNSIYFTKSDSNNSITDLWFRSAITALNQPIQLTYASYDNVYILDSNTQQIGNYLLAVADSTLYLLNGANEPTALIGNDITIMAVYGDSVIYSYQNNLYRMNNVKDAMPTITQFNLNGKVVVIDSASLFDYDGRNIYMFVNYSSESGSENPYLNRIDTQTTEPEAKFVGKFRTDDLPAKPDNTDLPEDEWEIWIK